MKWEFIGLTALVLLLVYFLSSGPSIVGFAVLNDVPSFIPSDARNLRIVSDDFSHSYEYESGGEWHKAVLLVKGEGVNCVNVSESINDLRFYQFINGERVDVTDNESYGVEFFDQDFNGLTDSVCWRVP